MHGEAHQTWARCFHLVVDLVWVKTQVKLLLTLKTPKHECWTVPPIHSGHTAGLTPSSPAAAELLPLPAQASHRRAAAARWRGSRRAARDGGWSGWWGPGWPAPWWRPWPPTLQTWRTSSAPPHGDGLPCLGRSGTATTNRFIWSRSQIVVLCVNSEIHSATSDLHLSMASMPAVRND